MAKILKFLSFQQLLKHILRVFSSLGGDKSEVCGLGHSGSQPFNCRRLTDGSFQLAHLSRDVHAVIGSVYGIPYISVDATFLRIFAGRKLSLMVELLWSNIRAGGKLVSYATRSAVATCVNK